MSGETIDYAPTGPASNPAEEARLKTEMQTKQKLDQQALNGVRQNGPVQITPEMQRQLDRLNPQTRERVNNVLDAVNNVARTLGDVIRSITSSLGAAQLGEIADFFKGSPLLNRFLLTLSLRAQPILRDMVGGLESSGKYMVIATGTADERLTQNQAMEELSRTTAGRDVEAAVLKINTIRNQANNRGRQAQPPRAAVALMTGGEFASALTNEVTSIVGSRTTYTALNVSAAAQNLVDKETNTVRDTAPVGTLGNPETLANQRVIGGLNFGNVPLVVDAQSERRVSNVNGASVTLYRALDSNAFLFRVDNRDIELRTTPGARAPNATLSAPTNSTAAAGIELRFQGEGAGRTLGRIVELIRANPNATKMVFEANNPTQAQLSQ